MPTKIVSKTYYNPEKTVFEMIVDAPKVAKKAHGGNFVILRLNEYGERFPLTIADYDREAGTITMVVMAIGKSTLELSLLNVGDEILDFVGPLGNPAHVKKYEHPVVLIGGGIGIAPIFPQAKEFKAAGNEIIIILGTRNKDLLFWQNKFETLTDKVIITTDDGTAGRKGLVTDVLKELLKERPLSHVIAIGPLIMMKFVALTTNGEGDLPKVPTTVSLNPIMIDGTGMCGGCRFNTLSGEIKFACVDGPDVDGHDVDFKNLMERNGRFKKVEKKRHDDFKHECKMAKITGEDLHGCEDED